MRRSRARVFCCRETKTRDTRGVLAALAGVAAKLPAMTPKVWVHLAPTIGPWRAFLAARGTESQEHGQFYFYPPAGNLLSLRLSIYQPKYVRM